MCISLFIRETSSHCEMNSFLNQIWVIRCTGLDNLRTCVRDVLEIVNYTNCRTWLFLTSTLCAELFSFLNAKSKLAKLGVHTLDSNSYVRFINPVMSYGFHCTFYVLDYTIWNLIVSKNNLRWSCLPAFANNSSLKDLMEKLKSKPLDEVIAMLWFFGFLKNT